MLSRNMTSCVKIVAISSTIFALLLLVAFWEFEPLCYRNAEPAMQKKRVTEDMLALIQRPIVDLNRIRTPFVNTEVTSDCKIPEEKKRQFYSQSNEDWTLLNLYFGNPVVCNGTFVELGAVDGVLYSNTKFYEDTLGWRGLLIEANPDNFAMLRKGRPRSRKFFGAVCPAGQTNVTMVYRDNKNKPLATGGDKSQMTSQYEKRWIPEGHKQVNVPCRPLADYLREADIRHVDLLSLDVEGAEFLVLQTMDWDIPVYVIMIEMGHDRDQDIRDLVLQHGYFPARYDFKAFCKSKDCANNEVFVNPTYSFPTREHVSLP